ncbi:MAG: hypothetical protein RIF46_00225 [Cyclobacteriaceae bacterium]
MNLKKRLLLIAVCMVAGVTLANWQYDNIIYSNPTLTIIIYGMGIVAVWIGLKARGII